MLKTSMRDKTKYASAFTKWVDETVPHTFYLADVDSVVYKLSNNMVRIYEWKYPKEELTKGQKDILPKLAEVIKIAIEAGALNPQSGVYVIRGEPPFTYGAEVRSYIDRKQMHFTREGLIDFVKCDLKFPD